ncbi:MAG: VacJ family lipoprotein [Halieaceae bacterium]
MNKWTQTTACLLLVMALGACSSNPVDTAAYPEPVYSHDRIVPEELNDPQVIYDPWTGMNRRIYNFNYHFDRYVFLPVVRGYKFITPDFLEAGLHNFFNNFRDVRTLANSILQLSPDKTAQAAGRVMVNTTIGLLGFVDMASKMDLPRPSEDFGQTLGHYGVGAGPYLVVPFLGPSNLRDGFGLIPDYLLLNAVREEVLADDLQIPAALLDAVDTRANVPFRYYETGSAYEYSIVRWLYTTKRELDVAK